MALPQFIFGGDTGMTPEQLKKNRAVAEALFSSASRTPRNVGEGISAIGQALAYRIREGRNEKAEKAIGEKQRELSGVLGQQYAAALGGGGSDFGAGAGYGSATGSISDGRYTTADLGGGSTAAVSIEPGDGDIYGDFIGTVKQGITNPFGLAAVASTGKRESGYSAGNAYRQWSDPSESGQAGQAGGIMSWRAERLANMRKFVADAGGDPNRPSAKHQAAFFLAEDPGLIERLNGAKSVEEAQRAMNQAWAFAGWDRPGGEAAARMEAARAYLPQFAGNQPAPTAPPQAAPVQVASLDPTAGMGAVGQPPARPGPAIDASTMMRGMPGRNARAVVDDPARMAPGSAPLNPGTQAALRGTLADPDMTGKNMAVARALGVQPQPMQMSAVAGALNGRPAATSTPRPDQMAAQAGAPVAPDASDQWSGLREDAIGHRYAQGGGQVVQSNVPMVAGRPIDSFDPQVLIGVLQNEYASPDQKQMAMDVLQMQGQRQQAAQAQRYKAWETQQEWAREDRRHAIDDRREDAKFGLDRARFEREGRAPIEVGGVLVDPQTMKPVYQAPQQPFTLQPGETRFDGAGNRIAAGGARPGYRTLTADEVTRLGLPKGSYQVSPEGKVEDIGTKGQTINVGGGENKQVFDAMAESAAAARSAATGLNALTEAKSALDAGIISGAGADWNLGLQKIGAALGVVDPTVIQNTETFRASIAPQVAAVMKATVGSANISNSDREFAEKAAGGSINLDAGSIRRLVDIMDRASRVAIQSHLERLDAVYPGDGQFDRERALFGVRMPEALPAPERMGAAPPRQAPVQAAPQMPAQAAPQQQAPAQAQPSRQRWDRGSPVRQPVAPPAGEYRWNPATRRMEAM